MFGTVSARLLLRGDSPHQPSLAASFALLIPIFGVLSSVVILGEELGLNTVVGAVAVIAGLWLIQRQSSDAGLVKKGSNVSEKVRIA